MVVGVLKFKDQTYIETDMEITGVENYVKHVMDCIKTGEEFTFSGETNGGVPFRKPSTEITGVEIKFK